MEDGNPWIAVIVTIILIGVNGMLASAEIALVGLNEIKLKQQAQEGDKKARMLLEMKQDPSNFLSTIQIGITLAGLLSGAFAADTLAGPLVAFAAARGVEGFALTVVSTLSVVLITLLLTYFMLVFGELVPKRVAMARPERTARRVVGPIHGLARVTKPLVRLLAASTNGVLRLVNIDPNQEDDPVTEEEILMMVREGQLQGTIEDSEVEFVSNLFAFTDLVVADAMIHRTEISAIPEDATLRDVVKLIFETTHNHFPVYSGTLDKVVGIFYVRDMAALYPWDGTKPLPTVRELMRPPSFVPESKSLVELFAHMKEHSYKMAVVVDEYGGTSGLITIMDIIEEIVGDIETTTLAVVEDADGSLSVDGLADMEDVATLLGLKLTEEITQYETLGGFVTARLGYIPGPGEQNEMLYDGYAFRVTEVDGARVQWVNVRRTEE